MRSATTPAAQVRNEDQKQRGDTEGNLSPQPQGFPSASPRTLPAPLRAHPRARSAGHNHQTHRQRPATEETLKAQTETMAEAGTAASEGSEPSCAARTTHRRCERAGSALAKSTEPGVQAAPGSLVRAEVRLGRTLQP